jgi:hypothetical protein
MGVRDQRGFNTVRYFAMFSAGPRPDIVIGLSVLDLFHQHDRLAADDLP